MLDWWTHSGRDSKRAEARYWGLTRQAVVHWPALALVNVNDSIRAKEAYTLVHRWTELLERHGYRIIESRPVPCPGHRHGAHHDARFDDEEIIVACKL